MHPGGIKFGLSQGLLELSRGDVVVSARFLDNLSEMARRKVRRRKRVMCIWDEVVRSALQRMPYSLTGVPRQEYVPFYTGLDRIILQTMMPIAERIQMGRRFLTKNFISENLQAIVMKDTRTTHPQTLNEHWRIQFRKNYAAIKSLCQQHAPEHLRHAELLSLCELNRWLTDRENRQLDEFTGSLFSKEFWERMTGQPSDGPHRDS
jgi:hypothetical protein